MKINGLVIQTALDGSREIAVQARLENNEQLEAGDMDRLLGLLAEVGGAIHGTEAGEGRRGTTPGRRSVKEPVNNPPADTPPQTSGRGRRASTTATADKPAPAPSEPASTGEEAKPVRRRVAGAPPAEPAGVSDADLIKACTEAAGIIGKDLVMAILKEDHGVDTVNLIKGDDDRKKFIATLREQVELAEAEGK